MPPTLPACLRAPVAPPPRPGATRAPTSVPVCQAGPGDRTQSSLAAQEGPPAGRGGKSSWNEGACGSSCGLEPALEALLRSLRTISEVLPCRQTPRPCPTPGRSCLLFQQEGFNLQRESTWAENQPYTVSPKLSPGGDRHIQLAPACPRGCLTDMANTRPRLDPQPPSRLPISAGAHPPLQGLRPNTWASLCPSSSRAPSSHPPPGLGAPPLELPRMCSFATSPPRAPGQTTASPPCQGCGPLLCPHRGVCSPHAARRTLLRPHRAISLVSTPAMATPEAKPGPPRP